jgi:hypothetical protein
VNLYLHSPNTPLWRGAQLKHRDNFTFYFIHYISITVTFRTVRKCSTIQAVVGMWDTKQLQPPFTVRFVTFDEDGALFKTFTNNFEVTCENDAATSQLELINLPCSDKLRPKFFNFQRKMSESVAESTYLCKTARNHLLFVNKLYYRRK